MIPTIVEASAAIAAKRLSPVELADACLDRVARLNPALGAFIAVTADRARTDARAAEARAMAGTRLGPLDGIPFAHKDIFGTAGLATTAHSAVLRDHVPAADATVVAKLAAAGVVMLGKLATHEFAWGGPSFDLPWPPARNPWNPAHFPAGSSSGTGAAVASGMILGGTGSDTGGSIRGPAALCGIAGVKPTYGRCSRAGVLPLAQTLDHTGPMAWTVADCALLLQAMAGHDPTDPASADVPVPDFSAGIDGGARGLRVGLVRHFHEREAPVGATTVAAIDAAAAWFAGAGATVVDVVLPSLAEFNASGWPILMAEAWSVHAEWMRADASRYGQLLRDRLMLSATVSAEAYLGAQKRRRDLIARSFTAAAECDVLLTAAAYGEAPLIEAVSPWAFLDAPTLTMPGNVLGWPAMSVCAGFGAGGLPLAIQLVGKPFAEPVLLRAGHAYEQAMGWRARRPTLLA